MHRSFSFEDDIILCCILDDELDTSHLTLNHMSKYNVHTLLTSSKDSLVTGSNQVVFDNKFANVYIINKEFWV